MSHKGLKTKQQTQCLGIMHGTVRKLENLMLNDVCS